ncbi:MAG TPA: hypothetical protein VFQ85_11005 [Mycobacteriales bacterium]|nr:hypothetical protein [Mycobacteriales bacterium]
MTRAAVRDWLLSRGAVLALAAVAAYVQIRHGYGRSPVRGGATGLFVWDGDWYRDIAVHGYGGAGRESLRFFPLVPLLARPFVLLGPAAASAAVLVVANASALAYALGLSRLARLEGLGDEVGERAAWLALWNPAAFVLVLPYAEATAAALAVWCLYALRRRAWLAAAALGFLCGLARPIGLLVALPALVEAARGWRSAPWRDVARRVAAAGGGPAGCAAYLAWCGLRYGDPLLPFRVQQRGDLRGGVVVWPGRALGNAWLALVHHGRVTTALRLVWVPLVLALLVLVARRLPASYTAFAGAVVVLAVGTPRLASFERYSMSAFPLVLVAASLRSRHARAALRVACGLGLAGYGILAFASTYVP